MNTPILDCKVGDLIQYTSQLSDKLILAIIVGETTIRDVERWRVKPLNNSRKAYTIKKIVFSWKKLA